MLEPSPPDCGLDGIERGGAYGLRAPLGRSEAEDGEAVAGMKAGRRHEPSREAAGGSTKAREANGAGRRPAPGERRERVFRTAYHGSGDLDCLGQGAAQQTPPAGGKR